ncbi:MAG: hypothetical protein GX423_00290 [Nitrospiraceae bacterium]|jgi:uncharacterized protein (DUF2062 family)|nr:hypothetical protein [Nitrospiraceae bacterium]
MLPEIDVRPTTIIVEVLLAYAFATIVYEVGAMTIRSWKEKRDERRRKKRLKDFEK